MISLNKVTSLTTSRYFQGTTLYVPSKTLLAGSMVSPSQRAPRIFEMHSFAKFTPFSVRASISLFVNFTHPDIYCSLPDCTRTSH